MSEKFVAQEIKDKYVPREKSNVDTLKELDAKVHRTPMIFAITFGVIATLIMGFGMCLALEALFNVIWLGIIIGVIGIALMCATYPIYKHMLAKSKKENSKAILSLSDEILNS